MYKQLSGPLREKPGIPPWICPLNSKRAKLHQTSKDYFPPVTGSLIDVNRIFVMFLFRLMCRCVTLILGNEGVV